MSEQTWQRARSLARKSLRENAILSSALACFQTAPYEDVTLGMIAHKAGITRTNIYRYFRSREEIFLSLYLRELSSWVDALVNALVEELSPDEFIRVWCSTLLPRESLLRLTPLFASSLEKNTSDDLLVRSKRAINDEMGRVVPAVRLVLPTLSVEQCYRFFLTHQALAAGIWPMHALDSFKLVSGVVSYEVPRNFEAYYSDCLRVYLSGLLLE